MNWLKWARMDPDVERRVRVTLGMATGLIAFVLGSSARRLDEPIEWAGWALGWVVAWLFASQLYTRKKFGMFQMEAGVGTIGGCALPFFLGAVGHRVEKPDWLFWAWVIAGLWSMLSWWGVCEQVQHNIEAKVKAQGKTSEDGPWVEDRDPLLDMWLY